MALFALPAIGSILATIGAFVVSAFTWITTRAAQRILLFTAFVLGVGVLMSVLDAELRTLINSLTTYSPDLGYFFNALAPDNFPSLITTIVTVETSLAVYRWGYKFLSAKAGIS